MAGTSTSPIAPLEYAKRPRLRGRKWLQITIGFAVVLALAAGWRWGPGWRDRIVLLYHQRACIAYTAPPEQVVFDSDPARVAMLARDPNYVIVRGCAFRQPPNYWDQYSAAVGPPWASTGSQRAMLFLHECRSPDGSRFIVEVERTAVTDESALFIQGYDVESKVVRPASATQPAAPIPAAFFIFIDVLESHIGHTDIRIFAGQSDTSDPSHFTIHFEAGGKTGTVDGRVDNQGRLTLTRPAGS